MGVASGHGYQEVGVASGWNLWVWLPCIVWLVGVVVRRYIDILTIIINFPYSTCISSFWGQQHPYFFVHFKNVFSVLFYFFNNI